jgi:hypothetical protein
MNPLIESAAVSALIFLGASAAILIVGCLTGRVHMGGLLRVKGGRAHGDFSPARVQTLIATLAAAIALLSQAATTPQGLPEPPTSLLLVLGGSQASYLTSKLFAMFFNTSTPNKGNTR